MACYRPMDGYRQEGGGVTIGWEPPGSREKVRVPCGSCIGCRMEYASNWALRLQHEAACWESNLFVTLTYDDDNLPWHRGLELSDLQKFMKRLRKAIPGHREGPNGKNQIRFFAAGEYGSETDRPHWHIALFNARLSRGTTPDTSPDLSGLWQMGMHTVSPFTSGRAGYIAGYAVKKIRGRVEKQRRYGAVNPVTGEWVERRPEFCVMSRKPGLGAYWFSTFRRDVERGYVVEKGGVKRRLPRFYQNKLMQSEQYAELAEERRFEWLEARTPGEDSPERRTAKELVHAARLSAHGSPRGL